MCSNQTTNKHKKAKVTVDSDKDKGVDGDEEDDVMYKKGMMHKSSSAKTNSYYCSYCDDDKCHEKKYGWFCIEECDKYLFDNGVCNLSLTEFNQVYQKTYSTVVSWEVRRKGNELMNENVIHVIPECMLLNSHRQCMNKFYKH